jgi:hypothetical protein
MRPGRAALATATLAWAVAATDEATAQRYAEIDTRVAAIVANMTLVQKAKQVRGGASTS